MEREEMQKKGGHSAHWIPCACALVLSLLLFTCFTANVFVTHHNFLRCERGVFMFPGYHKKVTCTREDPGPPNPGGSWHCCPEGWEGLRPSCLHPFGDNRTWVDSDRNCSALGARLASLPTQDQLAFTAGLLEPGSAYFLGLTYDPGARRWRWADGAPLDPGAGSGPGPHPDALQDRLCAVLVNLGERWAWSGAPCGAPAGRVCQLPGAASPRSPAPSQAGLGRAVERQP